MAENVEGQQIESKVSLDVRGFKSGAREAAASVQQMRDQVRSAMSGMDTVFKAIGISVVTSLAGISAAMALATKRAIDYGDEASKAAQKSGVTTEQFTGMAYAAKLADVGTEQLTRTYGRLNAMLSDASSGQKEAVEMFRRLQLDPESFRDADELLLTLADRFASMTDEGKRTALAIDMFGERLGPGLLPFLTQGRAGIEELRAEAERLGLVISGETGRAAEEFNDTLTKLQAQVQGLAIKLATAVLPTMQDAATALRDFTLAAQGSDFIGKALRVTFEALAVLGANFATAWAIVGYELAGVGARIAALARGDFSGFSAISEMVREDTARARAELDLFERRIMGLGGWGTASAEDRGFTPPAAKQGGGWSALAKKPSGKETTEKSRMPEFEAELEAARLAAAERDALRGIDKQAEVSFWQQVLATQKLSAADQVAVSRKLSQARIQLLQQEAREAQQIGEIQLASWRDQALDAINLEQERLRTRVALGQMTNTELLQQEAAFEQRRQQIKMAALTAQLAQVDPDRDPVKVAQLHQQIEDLERQHQMRLEEIRGKVATESMKLPETWQDAIGRMNSLWDKGLNAMMQGTLTWRGALQATLAEVVGWFGRDVVGKMAKKWLEGKAQELQATISGATTTQAVKAAEASTVVTANAASASSGAAAALAGIPIIGPALASGAFASMGALVLGALGMIRSAAGGYDIPGNVNPLTQLHAGEMVLPRPLADRVRGMTGSGGSPVNVTMNVYTPDADSFRASGDRITGELQQRLGSLRRGI